MAEPQVVAPFPLCWPVGVTRTPKAIRVVGRFADRSEYKAATGLATELERFGASQVVVSTNIPVSGRGVMYSGQKPYDDDPAVAVWFTRAERPEVIAIDTYTTVAANLRAVHLTVESLRAIERHAGQHAMDRAMVGFSALPPPDQVTQVARLARPWWEVLAVAPTSPIEVIEAAYRALARSLHPDAGGSEAAMSELNDAIESAREARGGTDRG